MKHLIWYVFFAVAIAALVVNAQNVNHSNSTYNAMPALPSRGNPSYCTDCKVGNPCKPGGTGAWLIWGVDRSWLCLEKNPGTYYPNTGQFSNSDAFQKELAAKDQLERLRESEAIDRWSWNSGLLRGICTSNEGEPDSPLKRRLFRVCQLRKEDPQGGY